MPGEVVDLNTVTQTRDQALSVSHLVLVLLLKHMSLLVLLMSICKTCDHVVPPLVEKSRKAALPTQLPQLLSCPQEVSLGNSQNWTLKPCTALILNVGETKVGLL